MLPQLFGAFDFQHKGSFKRHSLRVQGISWSRDGEGFYTTGGEGALYAWSLHSLVGSRAGSSKKTGGCRGMCESAEWRPASFSGLASFLRTCLAPQ